MATTPDHIALTDVQKRQLAALADLAEKPWEQVLAEALEAYRPDGKQQETSTEESFLDAAKRLGLIGCVGGAPADLSTNPVHLEGLGHGDS